MPVHSLVLKLCLHNKLFCSKVPMQVCRVILFVIDLCIGCIVDFVLHTGLSLSSEAKLGYVLAG